MKSLFETGMKKKVFSAEEVLALIYGEVEFEYRTRLKPSSKRRLENMFAIRRWWINRFNDNIFDAIPLKMRLQAITPVINHCIKEQFFDVFEIYALCALSAALGNNAWTIESKEDDGPVNLYDYGDGGDLKEQTAALTEMWIWYHLGIIPSSREEMLIGDCWMKILGISEPKDKDQTKELITQKLPELENALRKAENAFNKSSEKQSEIWQQIEELKKTRKPPKVEKKQKIAELKEKAKAQQLKTFEYSDERYNLIGQVAFLKSWLDFEDLKDKRRI